MNSKSLLALAALIAPIVSAIPCVQFDTAWNLYAFGGSSDVNLGQNTTWGSPSPQTLTTSGRPPWTGNNTQCLLSQYNNAMYVLGADSSNPSTIYIYSFGSSSWSTQQTSSAPSNLGNSRSASVLDHDTNVLFTLTSGDGASLYQLDMSSVTSSASSSSLAWEAVSSPSFSTSGYTPTAAQASNHINYFGVPSTAAGSADIFVVHYAYFQPEAQSYPTQNGGSAFPDTAGQAISIPNAANNVPLQMVFVPNDFSNTYVVTHYTDPSSYNITTSAPFASSLINSTQTLAAPTSHDSNAAYAASDTALVQIDSEGNIYYMTNAVAGDYTVQSGASWTKMGYTLSGTGASNTGGSSASASASASASMSAASGSASRSASASGSRASGAAASGASAAASASASASSTGGAGLRAALNAGGLLMGVAAVAGALLL